MKKRRNARRMLMIALVGILVSAPMRGQTEAIEPREDAQALLPHLRSSDATTRLAAARALFRSMQQLGDKITRLAPDLRPGAEDEARWLELHQHVEGVARHGRRTLIASLSDPDPNVVVQICGTIGMLGTRATPFGEALVAAWQRDDRACRRAIVWALAHLSPPPLTARPLLIEALRSRDAHLAQNALFALKKLGFEALPAVPQALPLLTHEVAAVRENVGYLIQDAILDVHRLQDAGDAEGTRLDGLPAIEFDHALLAMLDEAWKQVRSPLEAALSDPEEIVAAAAACGIGAFRERGVASVPSLMKAWDRNLPKLRYRIVWAFSKFESLPDETVPLIDAALRSSDEDTLQAATWAAKSLGTRAAPLLDRLRACLKNPKKAVAVNATYALEAMGEAALPAVDDLVTYRDEGGHAGQILRTLEAIGPRAFEARRKVKVASGMSGDLGKPTTTAPEPFPGSELEFTGVVGERSADDDNAYALVGHDPYRTRTNAAFDEGLRKWKDAHPSCRVVPVSGFEANDGSGAIVRLFHVWLVDDDGSNAAVDLCAEGLLDVRDLETFAADHLLVDRDSYVAFLEAGAAAAAKAEADELGIHGSPTARLQRRSARAWELLRQRRWKDALVALEAEIATREEVNRPHPRPHLDRARCLEELGRLDDALAAIDAAVEIASRGRTGAPREWPLPGADACLERAWHMERHQDRAAAEAWLEKKSSELGGQILGPWLVGKWHRSRKRLPDALTHYDRAFAACAKEEGITFSDDGTVDVENPDRERSIGLSYLAMLLREIGEAAFEAGDHDRSWDTATQSIALSKKLTGLKNASGHSLVEPHLMRARVAIERGQWKVAEEELEASQGEDGPHAEKTERIRRLLEHRRDS